MSTLIVKVKKIDEIEKHPDADTLSILTIGGWNVIAKTEGIEGQTHVLYIPIDAVADKDHPFLGFLDGKRVKTIKLRGIISQGLCIPLSEVRQYLINKVENGFDLGIPTNEDGFDLTKSAIDYLLNPDSDINLAELLDIKKYVPPLPHESMLKSIGRVKNIADENFNKYTNIQHYANYINELKDELCCITEKLHGTSARFGASFDLNKIDFLVGSRNQQYEYPQDLESNNTYIKIFEEYNLKDIILELHNEYPEAKTIIIYGEIAGPGIQGKIFKYGRTKPEFFCYDISIDGLYLSTDKFLELTDRFNLQRVPILEINTKLEKEVLKRVIGGKSKLDNHLQEGIVIKPMKEKWSKYCGRVILKIISPEYLLKDYTDVRNI